METIWSPAMITHFQENLLVWYKNNARPLPWRRNKDPYSIWISEIMLQQTRVDTVNQYFPTFVKKYPTINALASANIQDILHFWQGMGYYKRAVNIYETARIICKNYQGSFPQSYQEILTLPGIGEYTAGAIASICFHQTIPAVDGNIKRVISRIFSLTEDVNHRNAYKKIKARVNQIIPNHCPGEFNQALMEIGAIICTPRTPKCQSCPVKVHCLAAAKKQQELLPIKSRKKKPKVFPMEIAIVKKQNKLLLVQRSNYGLLAGLWGLPMIDTCSQFSNGNYILDKITKQYGLRIQEKPILLNQLTHIFTHQIWKIHLYLIHIHDHHGLLKPYLQWVDKKELKNFPIPKAFQKCLKEYFESSLV